MPGEIRNIVAEDVDGNAFDADRQSSVLRFFAEYFYMI